MIFQLFFFSSLSFMNSMLNMMNAIHVQNCLAAIVTRTLRFSHQGPLLESLHRLPIRYRVIFTLFIHYIIHCCGLHQCKVLLSAALFMWLYCFEPVQSLRSLTHVCLGLHFPHLPCSVPLFSAEYHNALMCVSLCVPHRTSFCVSCCLS